MTLISLVPERGLLNDVAEILNRRQRAFITATDNCPDCVAARRKTFRCKPCGYVGVPVVQGCECVKNYPRTIARWREWREDATERGDENAGHLTAERCNGELAVLEATIPRLCTHATHRGEDLDCYHGSLSCPVCDDTDRGNSSQAEIHAYHIIRDLRRLLRSVGVQS